MRFIKSYNDLNDDRSVNSEVLSRKEELMNPLVSPKVYSLPADPENTGIWVGRQLLPDVNRKISG